MNDFFKNRAYVFGGIIIVGIIFSSGYYLGLNSRTDEQKISSIINKEELKDSQVDFSPFWKAWNVINEKYVPTNSTSTERVSDQDRVYGAIEGMVKSLGDPYTTFFPPTETKEFNEAISGQIEGVGMEVGIKDAILTVIAPVKNTPAYRAGIKAGDQILKIDDLITNGLSTEEAISHIRGKKGTSVKLTMLRPGAKEPYVVSIVRDVINMPTVETDTKGDVFIIRLFSFSAISPSLFRDALREFYYSGKNKLIIDLRGNPGGYLEAAQDMASWFLPIGKVIVTEDFRDEKDNQVFRSKGPDLFSSNLNLVVLIDGGSASASEILAGALHDHGVATLVGTQSFGKGSVQELVDITDDTSLKVTIAKWLTPNGTSISHNGLTPDVVVKLDEKKYLEDKIDTQLNKALEILAQ
ncbi:MAG: carboxyl-terminal processing protease [Parcubacteria bacterium C7867-006]|nr:MAG: carboxyl-terminal processing protease [Parcubacteria bacterium C7867-006]